VLADLLLFIVRQLTGVFGVVKICWVSEKLIFNQGNNEYFLSSS
jgi:hypothetical protein